MEQQVGGTISKIDVELDNRLDQEKELGVRELINDERRRVLAISIRAGSMLKRHRASEPITVLCTMGYGRFRAGAGLDDSVEISAGTLVALDPEIDHEVTADSDLGILVTRFK